MIGASLLNISRLQAPAHGARFKQVGQPHISATITSKRSCYQVQGPARNSAAATAAAAAARHTDPAAPARPLLQSPTVRAKVRCVQGLGSPSLKPRVVYKDGRVQAERQ